MIIKQVKCLDCGRFSKTALCTKCHKKIEVLMRKETIMIEYDGKYQGFVVYALRDGTFKRVTDGHKTAELAEQAYNDIDNYSDQVLH